MKRLVTLSPMLVALVAIASTTAPAEAAPPSRWLTVERMSFPRESHTATLLLDGTVLVVGGMDCQQRPPPICQTLASAEVYNPRTKRWTTVGSLNEDRHGHTATLLASGEVLVEGGRFCDQFGSCSYAERRTAELFDPSTRQWRHAAAPLFQRTFHTATPLMDGRIVFIGSGLHVDPDVNLPIGDVEIFDASSGTWAPGGSMFEARREHSATLLPTGQILLSGGGACGGRNALKGCSPTATTELYDVDASASIPGPAMSRARTYHTANLLTDGTVLVAGGGQYNGCVEPTATTEVYDPTNGPSGAWSAGAPMTSARYAHSATELAPDTILVAGGHMHGCDLGTLPTAEIYAVETGTWSQVSAMNVARARHTATRLRNGEVLVTGGHARPDSFEFSAWSIDSAEVFRP